MAAQVQLEMNGQDVINQMKQMNEYLKQMAEESKKVSKETEDISKKQKNVEESSMSMTDKVVKNYVNIRGVIADTASVFKGMYDTAKDLTVEFEKVNNQMTILKSQKSYGDIANQFNQLEKATGGVIDKLDILESVNKAVSFGIDLSGDKLLKLVDVSGKAALNMGVDLKFAFDSLIVGTARESKMILDNLGVMVDLEEAKTRYAMSIGKTADALTAEEEKTALLNNVLGELARTQSTIADETLSTSGTGLFNKVSRLWRDIKLEVGSDLSDIITYFDELGMSGIARAERHWNQAIENEKVKLKELMALRVAAAVDVEGGSVSEIRKKDLDAMVEYENKYLSIVDDAVTKMEVDSNALTLLNEIHSDSIKASTKIWNENQKEYHFLNAIEEKYGDKQRARYELIIEKEKQRIENAKSRGEVAEDTEIVLEDLLERQSGILGGIVLKTASWMLYTKNISDLFSDLRGTYEGDTNIRGAGTDETIKAMNENEEKVKQLSAKFRMRQVQKKYDEKNENKKAVKDDWMEVLDATVAEQKKMTELEQKNTDDEYRREVKAIEEKTALLKEGYEIEKDLAKQQSDWKKKLAEFDKKEAEKIEKKKVKSFLDEEFKLQDEKDRLQKMGLQKSAQFTSMLINDVLLGEKEFRKEMIGDFVKGIGDQMVADGTFHIFAGVAKGWAGNKTGWLEAKAGAAEVGAGITMGATAKAIGTTSSESESKSKETAAADRNSMKSDQKQKMDVYLYPDEKRWLRSLNKSNNKLGVQRGR